MKKIVMMILAVALVALPTKAQNFGEDQPQAQFQSTSAMQGSGSAYSSNPSLNIDGTAYSPVRTTLPTGDEAQSPSGPRKVAPVTPEGNPTPVGDAVLPLMLMALALGGVIYYRRRKALKC